MKAFILTALLTSATFISQMASAADMANMSDPMLLTDSAVELRVNMRKLWEDHITYTRNYIISDLANLGDKAKVAERLLKNQADIGDAIRPVYGAAVGDKLTELLKEHIVIATKVVAAAKNKQNKALKKASDDWNKNAEDIAVFLSSANPNWKKSDMNAMLSKHLELTTKEVVSRLKKSWSDDIAAYDAGHDHMLMFADELTKGIVKQFPDKFKNKNLAATGN